MEQRIHKPQLMSARKRSKNEVFSEAFVLDERFLNLGQGRKYLIRTYGCQANEADSERIAGIVEAAGFTRSKDMDSASLIIINTCAVRANAENKVYGEIGRLKKYKYHNPDLVIALGGCMAQEETTVEKVLKTIPHVDIVFGTHNLHMLLEYLHEVIVNKRRVIEVFSEEGRIIENIPAARDSRYKAWVNIMYGCDEFCSYCIVPYTRGKERSRDPRQIIAEVEALIGAGYKEITLLGQNVNSYGLDLEDPDITFPWLLAKLNTMPIPRIRFTTSHPKDFSDQLIEVLSKGGNLMPYIHLPVQSGSDRILKAMNRKYTSSQYLDLVERIYDRIPDISLTTDLIVGFPGETESDFEATLELVRKCRFEGAYTFIYSKREGTPAATYPDDVDAITKKERLYRLNELVNEGYKQGNLRFQGQIVEVLVEGASKTNPDMLSGYTKYNKLVNFKGPEDLIGKIIPIRVKTARTWSLVGELKDE